MILMICLDDSPSAENALKMGLRVAKEAQATVYITTSIEKGAEKDLKFIKSVENRLSGARERFTKENILCETDILFRAQRPGDDLVEFAYRNKIDVIVIGIKKTSKVGKMLFGSTAQKVILDAPCPVLTVK
jgi:nucleotide-binding universal stress UspA family protein